MLRFLRGATGPTLSTNFRFFLFLSLFRLSLSLCLSVSLCFSVSAMLIKKEIKMRDVPVESMEEAAAAPLFGMRDRDRSTLI